MDDHELACESRCEGRAHSRFARIKGCPACIRGGQTAGYPFGRVVYDAGRALFCINKDIYCASPGGAFLDGIDLFDPQLFNISSREAARIDPQQRLLLEVAWEALERAGQAPDRLGGSRTGVFVGISSSDYSRIQLTRPDLVDAFAATGNALSIAANRISYTLDLRGPSLAIDTACSSSLMAVHAACRSLLAGECDMALAGGVNVLLSPELTMTFSHARMMAADGRCKTFDERADGYVRGEGCGVVVLKRLSDALAGRDKILAVIRGSATNQDGRSNGLTAPNGPAQESVIRAALQAADLRPSQVGYVETHGTGTSLGDPIEVNALGAVLSEGRDASDPVLLGSVKTNIGHLEAAAGIVGLAKAVLVLQRGEVPPHLHFSQPNPYIDWSNLPVAVPVKAQAWSSPDGVRRAGVSSFGFSGTNAHIVLEEAPADGTRPERDVSASANVGAAAIASVCARREAPGTLQAEEQSLMPRKQRILRSKN